MIWVSFLSSLVFFLVASSSDFVVTALPQNPAPGDLVQVELSNIKPADKPSGVLSGRPLRFYTDESGRVRALCAVAIEQKPGRLALKVTVTREGEEPLSKTVWLMVAKRTFKRQTLQVDPKFTNPPKSELDRIRREQKELSALWAVAPTAKQWSGSFARPVPGAVGSEFGVVRLFNGVRQSIHFGLDLDANLGDEVSAIGAGTVVMAADLYYSGKTVIVDHGLKLFSMYFHLSSLNVDAGKKVRRGDKIGEAGSTGRSTGPHLHLSTKLEGVSFDPESLLRFDLSEGPADSAAVPQAMENP
jgi:murein DD-endopeptidase MepM/ murein hydrolase activator NlpD